MDSIKLGVAACPTANRAALGSQTFKLSTMLIVRCGATGPLTVIGMSSGVGVGVAARIRSGVHFVSLFFRTKLVTADSSFAETEVM